MNIKVEHLSLINIRTGTESEVIRIGLIDHTGHLDKIELSYKTENGKVKIV